MGALSISVPAPGIGGIIAAKSPPPAIIPAAGPTFIFTGVALVRSGMKGEVVVVMGRSGVSLSIVSGISVCGTSACVALSSIVVAVSSSAGSTFSTISTSWGFTTACRATFGVTTWAMSGVVCQGSATVVESVTTATGVNGRNGRSDSPHRREPLLRGSCRSCLPAGAELGKDAFRKCAFRLFHLVLDYVFPLSHRSCSFKYR